MKTIRERILFRLGLYQRRFLNDPLTRVPEFAGRIPFEARSRYGSATLSNQATAENLLFAVEYAVGGGVPGDIAEFGCMTGRTANVIAAAMSSFRADKKLHLFDSFEGLPKSTSTVDLSSPHVQDGTWAPGTCKGISPSTLRKICEGYLRQDQVAIYEGWFSATLPKIPAGTTLSMLHVDCDLYQSAIDVLDYVFKHRLVSDGAIILFDDWYCNRSSNQHGERMAWRETVERYTVDAEDHGSYGWSGKKFIVHGYMRN